MDAYVDDKSWNSLGTNGLNNCQYIFYIQYVTPTIDLLRTGGEYLTQSLTKQTKYSIFIRASKTVWSIAMAADYTVGHKKGATFIFTITLANVDRFQ